MSLASLDLNLLLVLHTVLTERSVARAAERLHVTPSAISNALARLRSIVGDPLVTRQGRGVVPTPRALELAPVVARALGELELVMRNGPFDAARCTRTFTLALADAGQIAFLPRVGAALAAEMPLAQLRVIGIDSLVSLGDLASAEVDLQLGMAAEGPGVHVQPLFEEPLCLVARSGHPAAGQRLSARDLGALAHVAVDLVPGKNFQGPVAAAYARAGIPRRVVMSVPSFTTAAAVITSSDWVTVLPASLLAVLGAALGLRALTASLPLPAVPMALCWHERTHADAATAAFRDLVRRALAATGPRPPPSRGPRPSRAPARGAAPPAAGRRRTHRR